LLVILFLNQSCTIESPGVSVKTYREPAAIVDWRSAAAGMLAEIERMNRQHGGVSHGEEGVLRVRIGLAML
jgi:hypothetical protein